MAELPSRLSELRDRVQPAWSPERERRVRARVERGLLTRRRRRSAVAAAMAAAFAVLALLSAGQWLHDEPQAPLSVQAETTRVEPTLRFADGSEVFARTNETQVESLASNAEQVLLKLTAGSARFSVTPNAARSFRVVAGAVTVQVVGTVFSVTREAGQVSVAVERGRVRVEAPGGERELSAGERGVFDEAPKAAEALPLPVPSAAPSNPPPRAPSPWRALAQDGEYAAAFAELEREGARAVRDVPEDLLLAADAARLGGRPDKAVPHLERLVRRHSRDARAPLAAFTLGRTLLEQLGRPREAAQAFATARRLDGSGALAEDALAREVDSWSRAGDTTLARERAREFLARYPDGRRAALVRRLGGID
jgi:transmembrane sensor